MSDLVFIGLSRAGLEEAQRDRDRYAAQIAGKLWAVDDFKVDDFTAKYREELNAAVRDAMACPVEWPTHGK